MRLLVVYILSLYLVVPCSAQTSNCTVSILTERNSGEKIRVNFKSTLGSKEECKALADMHHPNFSPDQVRNKTVSYQWASSAAIVKKGKQKSPSLANTEKRRSFRNRSR